MPDTLLCELYNHGAKAKKYVTEKNIGQLGTQKVQVRSTYTVHWTDPGQESAMPGQKMSHIRSPR